MATKKLYDIDAYQTSFEAEVLSCEAEEGKWAVILDATCFFPEEGGQTPDRGWLIAADADGSDIGCSQNAGSANETDDRRIQVLDVQIRRDGTIVHTTDAPLTVGSRVCGEIDWKRRFYNMQQHTGEHIFSGLAYKRFGYHNVGFHLSNQIVTMDFDGTFTEEELAEMELAVNEAIVENVPVHTGYPTAEELERMEYRSKIDIDGAVRIVEVEGYDICACCAPHVHRTGEIGMFKIQSAQSYKGGVRISFLCGFRALAEYQNKSRILAELSGILTTNQEQLAENVSKLKAQTQSMKNQLNMANQTIMEYKLGEIDVTQADVLLFEKELETPVIRHTVNKLVEAHEGICGVFVGDDSTGYQFIIGSRTADCREIAAMMREKLGARGGGSAQMIQGSVQAEATAVEAVFRS